MTLNLKSTTLALVALFTLASVNTEVQAKDFKAAEIFSNTQTKYGKYVVRMRAAKGSGVISNFFTYKNGSEQSSVFWEEIDVEVFGKNNANSWQSNLITGFGPTRTEGVHGGPNMADTYNTFTVEWTPNYVRWLVNGTQIRRVNGGQASQLASAASFRFNIWPPAIPEWVGNWNPNILPVHMYVNWVEFHSWNGSGFNLQWRDDFNSFDSNRWTKANHTFGENRADFVPANATVKNGYLVLSITRAGQEGYSGNPPADNGGSSGGGSVTPPSGWTNLQMRHSNKCFDVAGGRTNNGSTYHQWGCNKGNVNQRFKFTSRGNGKYEIRSQRSNRCVDLAGGGTGNGQKIHQWDCWSGNTNQNWTIVPKGNGWFELRAQNSNKCLDVSGVSQNNGAKYHQWQCLNGQNQQFRFLQ